MRLLAIFGRNSNVLLLQARLRKSAVSLLHASACNRLLQFCCKSAVTLLHASDPNRLLQFCCKSATRARAGIRVSVRALT